MVEQLKFQFTSFLLTLGGKLSKKKGRAPPVLLVEQEIPHPYGNKDPWVLRARLTLPRSRRFGESLEP